MARIAVLVPLIAALALAAPAGAAVPHTVQPGETLWSIAAQGNLTTRALAVFNGMPEDARVVAGQTVMVPSEPEAAAAMTAAGITPRTPAELQGQAAPADGQGQAAPEQAQGASAQAQGGGVGSVVVQWGDTLSGIAARAGVSPQALAAANGLDPAGVLFAGSTLTLPAPGGGAPGAVEAVPAPTGELEPASDGGTVTDEQYLSGDHPHPHPTPERVDAATIARIASEQGVSPSLASAIAWQESGFDNSLTSVADARGVMQIIPSTWKWIDETLTPQSLNPASAEENVRAGVVFLRHLLGQTGGDERLASAGYYQGLGSVRERGFYDDTHRYVDNVQALKARFGG